MVLLRTSHLPKRVRCLVAKLFKHLVFQVFAGFYSWHVCARCPSLCVPCLESRVILIRFTLSSLVILQTPIGLSCLLCPLTHSNIFLENSTFFVEVGFWVWFCLDDSWWVVCCCMALVYMPLYVITFFFLICPFFSDFFFTNLINQTEVHDTSMS